MSRFSDADRAHALAAARDHLSGQADCVLARTLKIGSGALVFAGSFEGAPAVYKWFQSDDAAETVAQAATELAALAPRMSSGPLQINRCLAALPDLGVLILSHAPGPRLTSVIADAAPTTRTALMQQAGHWLAAYVGDRHRIGSFGPGYWLKNLRARPVPAQDAALLGQLMTVLQDMAQDLHGKAVTQAATHGDFAAINLHYADGIMTGVDVQGTAWLPLARDVAKFLVWTTLHCPSNGPTLCGVPRDDLAAFLSAKALPLSEVETILPFFIGTQLYGRLLESRHHKRRGPLARTAIMQFLDWRSGKDSNPQPAD